MTLPSRLPRQCVANAWFGEHFGTPLPRELRDEAGAMSWDSFAAAYGHSAGPLRLRHFTCTDSERPAGRLGPQARNFRAVLAVGDHINTCAVAASGPVAALTAMLHARGITLETLSFHQMQSEDCTATFIRGSNGQRGEWALGLADDPTESALRAVIACANRLVA
ncbi:homocitrate synthase [Mycobacterium bourgelatii]|uniref:Homocitrate synthase n=1 Tax=Mycobacterium bourgelatii TaxID=1273442 RepID=A0A7I9YLQ2_MYCBU|nr:homocitrate synthase [Mycobacterium bourgelatii]MCV6978100.1 homocitrate synthase [Mycobacterium bourgelatii]GFG89482.1 hypothetical protein MBOU_15240 [Mycobacterium bourgelatii]